MFITPLINYIDLDVASVLFDLKGYFQPFPSFPRVSNDADELRRVEGDN